MNTTTHDNATTWRDLRDALTFDQVGWMLAFETDALGDPADVAEHLLEAAIKHVAQNKVDAEQFGHIPPPAGARKLWHWEQDDDGKWQRHFEGTERVVEIPGAAPTARRLSVDILGFQYPDGSVTRSISLFAESADMTVDVAREVAEAFTAAADELDRLTD